MMKPRFYVLFALVIAGGSAAAQTNQNVPGANDYAAFSKFVTDRNIFDPNREPRYTANGRRTPARPRAHSASTPAITLVGTMAYEKGDFAFFSSTDSEQKKILPPSEKIAGYTLTEISRTSVKLTAADKKELVMKVGDALRQDNSGWHLEGADETAAGSGTTTSNADSPGNNHETQSSPALEGNDVLKRLMEKRAQEEK